MTVRPQDECEGCKKQIGANALGQINGHVVCWDGINSRTALFHKKCNPAEPDLQRTHHVSLGPVFIDTSVRELKT